MKSFKNQNPKKENLLRFSLQKKKSILFLITFLFFTGTVINLQAQTPKYKSHSFKADAAKYLAEKSKNKSSGAKSQVDTIRRFNAPSYSTLGVEYDLSREMLWTAHECQSSSHNPTIYLCDTAGVVDTTASISLSEKNSGWPWQLDNRTGVSIMPSGNLLLPDYNGDLSYADDNIVEIMPDGTIVNAWEMDDEVGSNDSQDGTKIDNVIDIAVISATSDSIHAFATAAYDEGYVYEIVLYRTGALWTPNSWYTLRVDSVGFADNLGIDIMGDNVMHSSWNYDSILITSFDSMYYNVLDSFQLETPAGYSSGATFMEEVEPQQQFAVVDFDSDSVSIFRYGDIPNNPPTISDIQDQSGYVNTTIGPITFSVDDYETDSIDLVLTDSSDNQILIPDDNIVFGANDTSRTITITSATDQTGTATITITVWDEDSASVSDDFKVTILNTGSLLYVNSSTGADDSGKDGSESQPWATISYAISRATDGDTLDLTGTFTEDGTSVNNIGIQVSKDLTIRGQGIGQTIVQAHLTEPSSADRRCFTIPVGKNVSLQDMTIQNGNAGIYNGGCILNEGDLVVDECQVLTSIAGNEGGGIYNTGVLDISNTTLSGNSSTGNGGGVCTQGEMGMESSTVSGNNSASDGGGIYIDCAISNLPVEIINSTISTNTAGTINNGGGLIFSVSNGILDAALTNVTMADNSCGGDGAGIYEYAAAPTTSIILSIINSIFDNGTSNNYATAGSGTHTLNRTYTICSDNTMDVTGDGNMNDTDPLLETLSYNGGSTQTHAIPGNSPAVDAGTPKGVPAIDQRGRLRPQAYGYDIGSYERKPQIFFVNSMLGSDDISNDGSALSPWATITYAIGRDEVGDGDILDLTGTFTANGIATDGIQVTKSLIIMGKAGIETIVQANATGAASADRRCFTIPEDKEVSLVNLSIQNGNPGAENGGAILNHGKLYVFNCNIKDNLAENGAGIYSDAELNVNYSTISGNACPATGHGGAIYAYYANPDSIGGSVGTFPIVNLSMLNSTLSGNAAGSTSGNGGALYLFAKADTVPTKLNSYLTNVTIADNTCGNAGSGIYQKVESVSDTAITELNIKNSILDNGSSNNYVTNQSGSQATLVLNRNYTLCRDNSMPISGEGNINKIDPLLDALANNGGDTKTHAILSGSVAFDGGTNVGIAHGTDQRGTNHLGKPEIGAYEGNVIVFQSDGDWQTTEAIQDVIIKNAQVTIPSAKAAEQCNNLYIRDDGELTIDGSLTVNGNLTIESSSFGTGSLLDNENLTVNGTSNIQLYQGATSTTPYWHYASVPVDVSGGAITSSVFGTPYNPSGTEYYAFYYDEPNQLYQSITDNSTVLSDQMRGYAIPKDVEDTLLFEGEVVTGTNSITPTRNGTGTYEGFNLCGNPFPSGVDLKTTSTMAGITVTNLVETVWIRENGNFIHYNWASGTSTPATFDGVVPPMQAFWVKVTDGQTSGTLQLANDSRVHDNDLLYKEEEPNIFRISAKMNNRIDEAVIGLYANAKNDFDAYDSEKMFTDNPGFPQIYTVLNGKELAINGFSNNYDEQKIIPLGYKSEVAGELKFDAGAIKDFDPSIHVYLEDKLNNKAIDLRDDPVYSFYTDAPVNNVSRFNLVFTTGTIGIGQEHSQELDVFVKNNTLYLNSPSCGNASIFVSDLTGRMIFNRGVQLNKGINSLTISKNLTGVFLIKVVTNENNITKKVVLP